MTLNSEASQSARRRMTNMVERVMRRHPVVKKWFKWLKDSVAKKAKFWFNISLLKDPVIKNDKF